VSAGSKLSAPQAARVHPQDLERLADLIADRLSGPPAPRPSSDLPHDERLLSAREVAERYGLSARWVREHAFELGGLRLGGGAKPRLRFDAATVASRMTSWPPRRQSPTPELPAATRRLRRDRPNGLGTKTALLPIRPPLPPKKASRRQPQPYEMRNT